MRWGEEQYTHHFISLWLYYFSLFAWLYAILSFPLLPIYFFFLLFPFSFFIYKKENVFADFTSKKGMLSHLMRQEIKNSRGSSISRCLAQRLFNRLSDIRSGRSMLNVKFEAERPPASAGPLSGGQVTSLDLVVQFKLKSGSVPGSMFGSMSSYAHQAHKWADDQHSPAAASGPTFTSPDHTIIWPSGHLTFASSPVWRQRQISGN